MKRIRKILNKILYCFNRDRVEENWNESSIKMTRVLFEFDDGHKRELIGDAAHEWWYDLHRRNCGRSVKWERHKWKFFR